MTIDKLTCYHFCMSAITRPNKPKNVNKAKFNRSNSILMQKNKGKAENEEIDLFSANEGMIFFLIGRSKPEPLVTGSWRWRTWRTSERRSTWARRRRRRRSARRPSWRALCRRRCRCKRRQRRRRRRRRMDSPGRRSSLVIEGPVWTHEPEMKNRRSGLKISTHDWQATFLLSGIRALINLASLDVQTTLDCCTYPGS